MENFTPIKKIKRPVNKFLIFGNLILMLIIIGVGAVYVRKIYKGKAYFRGDCFNKNYDWTDSTKTCFSEKSGVKRNAFRYFCREEGAGGCSKNGQLIENQREFCFIEDCGVEQIDVFNTGGEETFCFVSRIDNDCVEEPSPTPPQETPTPTPTGEVTPTITLTPTPTETITPTITPTTTITITPTITPSITTTPGPTVTPIPVPCGTKDCDNNTNPCRSGYICVQTTDGSNYCSSPDFATACKANPSFNSCCTAPGEPTATPTTAATVAPTKTASVPSVGTPAFGIIGAIIGFIIVGLLL